MNCENCGKPMGASDSFCGACGASTGAAAPAAAPGIVLGPDPAQDVPAGQGTWPSSAAFPEPGAAPAAGSPQAGGPPAEAASFGAQRAGQPRFRLAHEEVLLKTYEAVQLRTGLVKRKRGQGTLFVTDARVVFYAWVYPRGTQRESWYLQQTKLEDVSGLSAFVSRRVSLLLLMLTIWCGLGAISGLIAQNTELFFIFLVLTGIFGFILFANAARRGSVGVIIKSRENDNSPISFGFGSSRWARIDGFFRRLIPFFPVYTAFDVLNGDPAEDADQLLHELGALILDLQTRGKMAYPHWGIAEPAGNGRAAGVS